MMAEGSQAAAPTLVDQVSSLYELIAGYHAPNLIEIAPASKLPAFAAVARALKPGGAS
jgi:hypothetical protein